MTTPPDERRRSPGLALLTGILVLAEAFLARLGVMVWNEQRDGHLTGAEAATFIVIGVSAAIGAVLYLFTLCAFARGVRGHGLARFASGLALLRLAGVMVALVAIAFLIDVSAIAGLQETFLAALAVLDALTAVYATRIAVRRTR
ncbi:hypothetical protein [Actinoplanes sp. NPDC026623]|uniref:hypothetical protein n=1 Tax=Actinoplanes sp. NPDC026623 TaxID=3155610 RepID=UPI0033CBB3CB